MFTRVFSLSNQVPIHVITGLHVDSEDFGVGDDSAVLEAELLGVVSVFAELFKSISVKPVSPGSFEPINWHVDAGLAEVLDIDGPGIVVALNGEDSDVGVGEFLLDGIGNVDSVGCHFFIGVVPHVVG